MRYLALMNTHATEMNIKHLLKMNAILLDTRTQTPQQFDGATVERELKNHRNYTYL